MGDGHFETGWDTKKMGVDGGVTLKGGSFRNYGGATGDTYLMKPDSHNSRNHFTFIKRKQKEHA